MNSFILLALVGIACVSATEDTCPQGKITCPTAVDNVCVETTVADKTPLCKVGCKATEEACVEGADGCVALCKTKPVVVVDTCPQGKITCPTAVDNVCVETTVADKTPLCKVGCKATEEACVKDSDGCVELCKTKPVVVVDTCPQGKITCPTAVDNVCVETTVDDKKPLCKVGCKATEEVCVKDSKDCVELCKAKPVKEEDTKKDGAASMAVSALLLVTVVARFF